jgi:hypothetical protein
MEDLPAKEPCNTPRRSLTHDQWAETFKRLYEKEGTDTAVGELAYFAWQVMSLCGDTDELAEFIDVRSLQAFESADRP